jgi:hypothetical protein
MQRIRTGGEASYPPIGDYNLIHSDPSTVSSQLGLKGGYNGCASCNSGGDTRRRGGYYYFDNNKNPPSTTAATATTATTTYTQHKNGGNDRRRRGGAPVELTAFISALALLGARLLADKNSSLNFFSQGQEERAEPMYQEQVGGRRASKTPNPCKPCKTRKTPAKKSVTM